MSYNTDIAILEHVQQRVTEMVTGLEHLKYADSSIRREIWGKILCVCVCT